VIEVYRRLGGIYYFRLHGWRVSQASKKQLSCVDYSLTLRTEVESSSKHRQISTRRHGVTAQKIVLFIVTAVSMSNLMKVLVSRFETSISASHFKVKFYFYVTVTLWVNVIKQAGFLPGHSNFWTLAPYRLLIWINEMTLIFQGVMTDRSQTNTQSR
jgi:hypothetical protein